MSQSFSGTSSDDSAGRHAEDSSEKAPVDGKLLERVLLETASAAELAEPGDDDWLALLAVARRLARPPFSAEPVLVEMVAAVLNGRLRLTGPAQDWQPMVRQIAATLFEDRPSHERLESLWERICEAAQ